MEFRLFDTPNPKAGLPGDAEWYANREVSDHINQPGHRERLMQAVELIAHSTIDGAYDSLSDVGAGNGGLLFALHDRLAGYVHIPVWGYDMSPLAVEDGKKRYGVDLRHSDIVKENDCVFGNIVVATEFLEHLTDPHELVQRIYEIGDTNLFRASVPGFENPDRHYEYHLWAWTGDSFPRMFERVGWTIKRHFFRADCGTQFLVAKR